MSTQLTIVQLDRSELHQMIREAVAEAVQSLVKREVIEVKEDEYLTRTELAKLLRISLSSLQRRIADGTIEPILLGGRILFSKTTVLDNLKRRDS